MFLLLRTTLLVNKIEFSFIMEELHQPSLHGYLSAPAYIVSHDHDSS